jgi:polysaccharide export outer membrane protein
MTQTTYPKEFMQITTKNFAVLGALAFSLAGTGRAQTSDTGQPESPPARAPAESLAVTVASPQYILRQGDVVQVKVYQEDDLMSVSRIGREGTIVMPLLGSVKVMSNTLETATVIIRDLLAKDYLVDPQVTLNVTEFAKRRFTVLGQVQHPSTYDMPADESVSLLQAIATAGGYTRIGNPRKITVQRVVAAESKLIRLDAEAMALDIKAKPFEILPDDVIIVGEKWL